MVFVKPNPNLQMADISHTGIFWPAKVHVRLISYNVDIYKQICLTNPMFSLTLQMHNANWKHLQVS